MIKRKSGNVRTPYQREKSKQAFLDAYASCAILHRSCEIANIASTTVRYWLNSGFMTQAEIDAAYESYQDRIRGVIHDLAIEGTDIPLNDGHGHVLLDASGNPLMRNTKDIKVLLAMVRQHLPEYKDGVNGQSSNTAISINIGTSVNNLYYVGIDLHGWNLDDVRELIAVVKRGESNKVLPEHSQYTIVESSQ
jgi:hypothetical protein